MLEMSESVWPDVDISDSDEDDDEETTKQGHEPPKKVGRHESITDEDLVGFPPLLNIGEKNSDSESDEEEEDEEEGTSGKVNMMNKLHQLRMKRNEARKLNHQEVALEDQRKNLPKNYEARRKQAEWQLEDKKARDAAAEAGQDYERVRALEETAEEVDQATRRKKKKVRPDDGFSDYATAQLRQYDRLTKQMKPELELYQADKEKRGAEAFPGAHNVMYGGEGKVSEQAVDRMVEDLEKQVDKRSKFHRRRQHFDDADIDYINERNAKFNQKAERFYGKYTNEIKQSLERGTAI